jgi:hypothetical protein
MWLSVGTVTMMHSVADALLNPHQRVMTMRPKTNPQHQSTQAGYLLEQSSTRQLWWHVTCSEGCLSTAMAVLQAKSKTKQQLLTARLRQPVLEQKLPSTAHTTHS